ncbi:hypothetical protein ACXJJ3_22860 [Kribbella sp. WER1]
MPTRSVADSRPVPDDRVSETIADPPDRPRTDPPGTADARQRDQAEEVAVERPTDDKPEPARDAADHLPTNLREQMRQDRTFTRLGWGVDEAASTHHDEAQPSGSDPADRPAKESRQSDDRRVNPPDAESPAAERAAADDSTAVQADDSAATSARHADTATDYDGAAAHSEDQTDPEEKTAPPDSAAKPPADMIIEHDRRWDSRRAGAPPGPLPKSAENLEPEVIERLDPGVRRILEYQGAAEYIAEKSDDRPWLEPAADAPPAAQRIFTAIDQGKGHAHIRHGPMGTDEMYARRVAYLEDPAQLDPALRAKSVDGLRPDKMHFCADTATRINDATAFAAAYAGVIEHPKVREVLDAPVGQMQQAHAVEIPIADLLGVDGHLYCTGYRLVGDWAEANAIRKEWATARAEGRDLSDLPEPQAERIPTFENGTMMVRFGRDHDSNRFYVATMFVQPPPDED